MFLPSITRGYPRTRTRGCLRLTRKTFQEIVCERGSALTDPCRRLGWGFLAAPSAEHVRMIAKIWQKGHTWGSHGYDTACIVNQMIGFNSMTSRFISQPIPAAIYVAQVWSSLYVFTFFLPQIYRTIWIIYLDLLWNFGVPSFPNKSRGLVERWLLWNLFEFVDIIHSGMSSLIFHLASPW